MPRVRVKRSKHWCFALTNRKEGPVLTNIQMQLVSYMITGKEILENGFHDIRGYVEFKFRLTLSQVKRMFPWAELGIKEGTSLETIRFCKKEVIFNEYGIVPNTVREAKIERWEKLIFQQRPLVPQKLEQSDNVWIVAPSGYGKTTYVWCTYPEAYEKMPDKMWTSYRNEDTIIIDDWNTEDRESMRNYIKRWASVFPFVAFRKGGGSRYIRPKKIVVTTTLSIEDSFKDNSVVEDLKTKFVVLNLTHWEVRHFYIELNK